MYVLYVNPVMLLRCNLYCTKFSDPDISVRIVTTESLYRVMTLLLPLWLVSLWVAGGHMVTQVT